MECLKIKLNLYYFFMELLMIQNGMLTKAVGTDGKMMRKTPFDFRFWDF